MVLGGHRTFLGWARSARAFLRPPGNPLVQRRPALASNFFFFNNTHQAGSIPARFPMSILLACGFLMTPTALALQQPSPQGSFAAPSNDIDLSNPKSQSEINKIRLHKWAERELGSDPEYYESLAELEEIFPEYFTENHVFRAVLQGSERIEEMKCYSRKDRKGMCVLFSLGSSLTGHPGIVHGGFTAMAIDNMMGWVAFRSAMDLPVFTAYLNVRYLKPVASNEVYKLTVEVDAGRSEGRKIFLVSELQGEEGAVHARAESLYVVPRDALEMQRRQKALEDRRGGAAAAAAAAETREEAQGGGAAAAAAVVVAAAAAATV